MGNLKQIVKTRIQDQSMMSVQPEATGAQVQIGNDNRQALMSRKRSRNA